MTRRTLRQRDPLEAAIEVALQPGRFIADRARWDFVSSLEAVAGELEKLIRTTPERAVDLYETFLAGCYAKAEELDDSGGNFGMLVDGLYCGWIKARQAAKSDADETARLLLDHMENDPYGFAHTLELDAVKVMDKGGLAAFARRVRARFDATDTAEQASDRARRRDPAYARRRSGDILRAIYVQQRDVPAYVALCEQTELSAQDCLAIATMLKTWRKRDEALAWVDRGLVVEKTHPHGSMARGQPALSRRGPAAADRAEPGRRPRGRASGRGGRSSVDAAAGTGPLRGATGGAALQSHRPGPSRGRAHAGTRMERQARRDGAPRG